MGSLKENIKDMRRRYKTYHWWAKYVLYVPFNFRISTPWFNFFKQGKSISWISWKKMEWYEISKK